MTMLFSLRSLPFFFCSGLILLAVKPTYAQVNSATGSNETVSSYVVNPGESAEGAVKAELVCPQQFIIGQRNILRFRFSTTSTDPIPYSAVVVISPNNMQFENPMANRGASWNTAGGTATLIGGTAVAGDTLKAEITLVMTGPGTGTRNTTTTINETPATNEQCTFPIFGPDIAIQKVVSTSTPPLGSLFAFGLNILNPGPVAVPNVVVQDILPDGLHFVSVTEGCSNENNVVTCLMDELEAGTIQFIITVQAKEEIVIENTVTIESGFPDPDESNNSSTTTVVVGPRRIALEKSVSADSVAVGDTLMYTLSLRILEGSEDGLVVRDTLPDKVAYLGHEAPEGVTCQFVGRDRLLTCTHPGERSAVDGALEIKIKVLAVEGGECPNNAVVFEDNDDGVIHVDDASVMTIIGLESRTLSIQAIALVFPIGVFPLEVDIGVQPLDLEGNGDGQTLSVDPFVFDRIYKHGTLVSVTPPETFQDGVFYSWFDEAGFPYFRRELEIPMTRDLLLGAVYVPSTELTDLLLSLGDVPDGLNTGETFTASLSIDNSTGGGTAFGARLSLETVGGLSLLGVTFTDGPCTTPKPFKQASDAVAECVCAPVDPLSEDALQEILCLVDRLTAGEVQRADLFFVANQTGTGQLSASVTHAGTDPNIDNNADDWIFNLEGRTTDADLGVTLRFLRGQDDSARNSSRPDIPIISLGEEATIILKVEHHEGPPVENVKIRVEVKGISNNLQIDSQDFIDGSSNSSDEPFCIRPPNNVTSSVQPFVCVVPFLQENDVAEFFFSVREEPDGFEGDIPPENPMIRTMAKLLDPQDRPPQEAQDEDELRIRIVRSSIVRFLNLRNQCEDGSSGQAVSKSVQDGPCVLRGDSNQDGVIDGQDFPTWMFEPTVPDVSSFLGVNAGLQSGPNQFQLLDAAGAVLIDEGVVLGPGAHTIIMGPGNLSILRHDDEPINPGEKRITFHYRSRNDETGGSAPELPVTISILNESNQVIKEITNFEAGDTRSTGVPKEEFETVDGNPKVRVTDPDGFEEYFEMMPLDDCVWIIDVRENSPTKTTDFIVQAVVFDAFGNRFDPPIVTANEAEAVAEVPVDFTLYANYPNPFNPSTQITYDVPHPTVVQLSVYNIYGQRVKTLVKMEQPVGQYTATWDGTNQEGIPVASGVYLYRMETTGFMQSRKMILVK